MKYGNSRQWLCIFLLKTAENKFKCSHHKMINMGDTVLILLELITEFIEARKYVINLVLVY
jgi:hypothetical protein